jgi:hypothetical protein
LLSNGEDRFAIDEAPDRPPFSAGISSSSGGLRRGDLIEVIFPGTPLILLFFVDAVTALQRGLRVAGARGFWFTPPPSSPPGPEAGAIQLPPLSPDVGRAVYDAWRTASPAPLPILHHLRLELRVTAAEGSQWRVANLAFSHDHPRFFGNLPSDEDLFRLPQGRRTPPPDAEVEALRAEAAAPRFPLAGPLGSDRAELYLPIGMASEVDPERARTAILGAGAEDGVDRFAAGLFLDRDLGPLPSGSLLREAEHKYYIEQQPLKGLYSLLPVDEVTLISVPDAVHRAWNREAPPATGLLAAPRLHPIDDEPDALGRSRIVWSRVPEANGYRLELDDTPDLTTAQVVYEGPETQARLTLPDPCPAPRYLRVRALRYDEVSAWSETRGRILPAEPFGRCIAFPIIDLVLAAEASGSPPDQIGLHWEGDLRGEHGRVTFELQRAQDADFSFPQVVHTGPGTEALDDEPKDAVVYYRVRVRKGEARGPWSNTVAALPDALSNATLVAPRAFDDADLLAIQRALLRFCTARGDLLCCLSLPRHYRQQEALDHLEALGPSDGTVPATAGPVAAGVPPLAPGEATVLSYGALYHPWLATAPEGGADPVPFPAVTFMPPDGAVVGVAASIASGPGAWLAPANRPFAGVIALDPEIDLVGWQALTAARVNVLVRDPVGFLALNAATLSDDVDLRLINVRRLLILLRRLALRDGTTYVFEPNDAQFRSLVRHRFERLLSDLYVRGALAGRRPEAAFRVVADETVNTRQSLDLGRFIVELRVAVSRPLAFLTVRLVQSGPEQVVVQEA